MLTETHQIISNEDAHRLWAPYGERGLSPEYGLLNLDTITPREAYAILKGSSEEDWREVHEIVEQEGLDWSGLSSEFPEESLKSEKVKAIFARSHEAQQAEATEQREQWLGAKGRQLLRTVGTAAYRLCGEGLITPPQLDFVQQNLTQADGTPTIQITPMTYLELERQSLACDNVEANLSVGGFVDYGLGIQYLPVTHQGIFGAADTLTLVHESVHATMQGMELVDTTRVDGWRFPFPSVHGLRVFEPTSEMPNGDNEFALCENMESNEGWTDFMGRAIMGVMPELGRVPVYGDDELYTKWASHIQYLNKNYPKVYRALTNAVFTQATPQEPLAKREALAAMNYCADKEFGIPGALNALFLASGSISDVFPKRAGRGVKQA
jgi:hypothetical protein